VLALKCRNWLDAWYFLLTMSLEQGSSIGDDLCAAVSDGMTDAALADAINGIGRHFLLENFGLIGKTAGRQALADHLEGAATAAAAKAATPEKRLALYKAIVGISDAAQLPSRSKLSGSFAFLTERITASSQNATANLNAMLTQAIQNTLPGYIESALKTAAPAVVLAEAQKLVPGMVDTEVKTRVPSAVQTEVEKQVPLRVQQSVDLLVPQKVTATLESAEVIAKIDGTIADRTRTISGGGTTPMRPVNG
jgi:hypothetical protein